MGDLIESKGRSKRDSGERGGVSDLIGICVIELNVSTFCDQSEMAGESSPLPSLIISLTTLKKKYIMDLLSSLGLESLPEQSTRLTSHPGIIKTLEDNADARLGFTHCCNCGSTLSDKVVKCKGCQRVSYCSKTCCKADTEEVRSAGAVEEETAFGHSAVICSLLKLCNNDEIAEDEMFNEDDGTKQKQGQAKEAALYRVQTEQESYPATLFNIMAESPTWFMEAMTRRIRYLEDPRSPEKPRRGKRDRTAISPNQQQHAGNKQLVIHIVGASSNSELWGWDGKKKDAAVLEAYAEAATNLLSYFESFPIILASIRLVFIGPDCPKSDKCTVSIPDSKTLLVVETHCCNYGQQETPIPTPDVIVFFNPGFSCPDYDWSVALTTAAESSKTRCTPFLVTTNTEMEGFADIKCLLDGGYIDSMSIPGDILEAVDHYGPKSKSEDDDLDKSFFFGENPYHGLRVRQSGTMANDVFVKSGWMFGGLFQKSCISKQKTMKVADDNEEDVEQPRKKHRGSKKGKGNSKKRNPALI